MSHLVEKASCMWATLRHFDGVRVKLSQQIQSYTQYKYKDEIDLKFESFKHFLERKGAKTQLAKAFLLRRLFTIILVMLVNNRFHKNNYISDGADRLSYVQSLL